MKKDLIKIIKEAGKILKEGYYSKKDITFKAKKDLVTEYDVDTFVIGLPKNMDGSVGDRGLLVKKFADDLNSVISGKKMIFWDERLSTVAAQKSLIAADVSRAKRKKVIDKMAAVFILQGYLDSRK